MKCFDWSVEKNEWLRKIRGITFDDIVYYVQAGNLLDILEHGESSKHAGQRILVVDVEGYVYLVPFVESEESVFLKTIIPSRKMTRRYLGSKGP